MEWIKVENTPETGRYLCLVLAKGAHKPYQIVLVYGHYEYGMSDWHDGGEAEVPDGESYDENDGMFSGEGWHDEINGYGGEFDRYIEVYRKGGNMGDVLSYQALPEPP